MLEWRTNRILVTFLFFKMKSIFFLMNMSVWNDFEYIVMTLPFWETFFSFKKNGYISEMDENM